MDKKRGGVCGLLSALLAGQLMWNVPLLICGLLLLIIYFRYLKQHQIIAGKQALLFIGGVGLLYIIIGSPLLPISYLSFSLHMIQMSILFFIIPPLLLLGIPWQIYEQFQNSILIKRISSISISPMLSLIFFAILFLLYHFPVFLIYISEHTVVQKGYVMILFILSLRMVWPIVSPHSNEQLSHTKRKRYISISGFIIMPACLLFIVSAFLQEMSNPFLSQLMTHLCLPANSSSVAILPAPFNTKYDQMIAGVFMLGLHKFSLQMTNRLGKNNEETP